MSFIVSSVVVSMLQSLGLLARVRRAAEPEANPFLEGATETAEVRRVRLVDLMHASASDRVDDEVGKLVKGSGLALALGDIYRIADVAEPDHGMTIDKAARLVQSLRAQGAADEAVVDAVTVELAAAQLATEGLVDDAVRRDKALDLFDAAVDVKVGRVQEELAEEEQRLQAEIDALQARIAHSRAVRDGVAAAQRAWKTRKRGIEEGWVDALRLLVEADVVSVTELPE